jgi:hypothetical protein
MEKSHITHVNDGFVFLGHRIIRKRGPKGNMRVISGIPMDKAVIVKKDVALFKPLFV